ncbi:MAG: sucrase ferredoxin [Pseudonocardia sp.]
MGAATTPGSLRCAVLARALDEPLAGTAPVADRWLCVEQPGAWPQEVTDHPDPAIRELAGRTAAAGWRLLLIRRPGRRAGPATADPRPGGSDAGWWDAGRSDACRTDATGRPATGGSSPPVRVFLADTAPGRPRVTTLTLPPAALAGLDLPAPADQLPGTQVDVPLLLVCTHGRRDRCCALDGRALVAAVTAGCPEIAPHVWESSHLGGHRFAPTALVLPTGYLYGRLDPATALEVHKAARHGEMEPSLCRGRSTWSPEGQVAELAVRRVTGLRDAAALRVEPGAGEDRGEGGGRHGDEDGGQHSGEGGGRHGDDLDRHGDTIVRAVDGRRWAVRVDHEPVQPRPTSCGADPSPVATLRAGPVRPLDPADTCDGGHRSATRARPTTGTPTTPATDH